MHALITGAAGQDGIILSQLLLADGYRVTGLVKPGTPTATLLRYAPGIVIVEGDLGVFEEVRSTVVALAPDEIYNLGGISSIMESVNFPEMTHQVNVGAVEAILLAMTQMKSNSPRFVQAASGTIFEGTEISPQNEFSPRSPKTPYAIAKAESLQLIDAARAAGLFATAAILYNHESPLRGSGFVTRRITEAAARIAAGQQEYLELGNVDVSRDWGWAPDYVRGMRLIMGAESPHDYVLATGESHELTEFIELAFQAAGIADWQSVVRAKDELRRATDPTLLRGDSTRAYTELGWQHTKNFAQIAEAMVSYDVKLLKDSAALWHE